MLNVAAAPCDDPTKQITLLLPNAVIKDDINFPGYDLIICLSPYDLP